MTEGKTAMEFVKYIVNQLCEIAEEVVIEQKTDELGILITIQVAESDMGRLIGKKGQTISAMRTLVRIIGAKEDERINLKVVEPSES